MHVRGVASQISQIQPYQMSVVVDLAGQQPGWLELPVRADQMRRAARRRGRAGRAGRGHAAARAVRRRRADARRHRGHRRESRRRAVSSRSMPQTVSVTVRGSRAMLARLDPATVTAYIDRGRPRARAASGAGARGSRRHADDASPCGPASVAVRDPLTASPPSGCSARTASAASRACGRSTRRRSRGSARRSSASGRPDRPSGSSSAATRASPASGSSASSRAAPSSQGAEVTSAGVVPTPGVAYLARALDFDLGVVLSASHNPYARQRHQGLLRPRREVRRARRARRRSHHGRHRLEGRRRGGTASVSREAASSTPYLDHVRRLLPVGRRACTARGSRSTWPTARRRRRRDRLFESLGFRASSRSATRPTAATSIWRAARRTRRSSPAAVVAAGLPPRRGVRRRRRSRDLRRSSRPDRRWRRRAAHARRSQYQAARSRSPATPWSRR